MRRGYGEDKDGDKDDEIERRLRGERGERG